MENLIQPSKVVSMPEMSQRSRRRQIVESIEKGFLERAAALRRLYSLPTQSILPKELLYGTGETLVLDLISISRRYQPPHMSSHEYISDIDKLLPSEFRAAIITYYYSGASEVASEALLRATFLSDTQLSVIAQTLVIWNRIGDRVVIDAVKRGSDLLISTLGELARSKVSFADPILKVAFGAGTDVDERMGNGLDSISKFQSCLTACKEAYVHLLGPDIFEILRKSIEPEHVISEATAAQFLAIADNWKIGDIFRQCLTLRLIRNLPRDRFLSRLMPPEIQPSTILQGTVDRLEGIQANCDEIDSSSLTNCVLEAYNFDGDAVYWIDWDTVYECVAIAERSVGFKEAALHLLMGQRQVQECFPLIAMAEGDGAFTSSLRATVRDRRIRDLKSLTTSLAELSGRTCHLVAAAILQHDNSLELAGLIGYDPPWAKRLIQAKALSFDARATAFRHDAANAFLKANIITEEAASEIKANAITSLRVAYLRGRQQNGLVHLRLSKITQEVKLIYSEPATLVNSIISTSNLLDASTYKSDVVETLSKMVTDHVLLVGPDALKTTVSDSLRHGQLRNRFLQAFDDALLSTSLAVTDTHAFYTEASSLSHPHNWIVNLRQRLRSAIRDFNERHLSVDERSVLYANILRVTKVLLDADLFSAGETKIDRWESSVEGALSEFLGLARAEFVREFSGFCETLIAERREVSIQYPQGEGRRINAAGFYEALVHNLRIAIQECSGWIAIARDENFQISFQDLVQLCLVTHSPGNAAKLQVKAIVSEYRKEGLVQLSKDRLLAASMFEPLETICKNLISNCFEHSGLGRNVNIELQLSLGKDRLTIHSRNTLSNARHRLLMRSVGPMQAAANAPSMRRAGDDQSSGLAKIAWACNRFFGSMPKFKIALGQAPLTFNVSVDVKTKHAVLVS